VILARHADALFWVGRYLERTEATVRCLDYAANSRFAERLGQASPGLDPHGVLPCAGEERYVAVGVETGVERQALETLLDGRDLGDWCGDRDAFEAAAALRGVGVPAYAVLRPSDLYEDPQLVHRGFFETLDHPVMGPTPYDGPATIYSRTPQRLRAPAPSCWASAVAPAMCGVATT